MTSSLWGAVWEKRQPGHSLHQTLLEAASAETLLATARRCRLLRAQKWGTFLPACDRRRPIHIPCGYRPNSLIAGGDNQHKTQRRTRSQASLEFGFCCFFEGVVYFNESIQFRGLLQSFSEKGS